MAIKKDKLKYEEIIIIAVAILLILGIVLIFAGLKTSIFGDKAQEAKQIKEQILQNIDVVEKNLDDVDKVLNIPEN